MENLKLMLLFYGGFYLTKNTNNSQQRVLQTKKLRQRVKCLAKIVFNRQLIHMFLVFPLFALRHSTLQFLHLEIEFEIQTKTLNGA